MITVNSDLCIRCGSCVRLCPMGYLELTDSVPQPKKRRRCIMCGHCEATCPKQALTLSGEDEPLVYTEPGNEFEEFLLRRRSVRHFRKDPPPLELLEHIIRISAYAPSGKNVHTFEWTILYGFEETNKVTDMALDFCARTGEAKELLKIKAAGTNLLTCDAPCVIIAWAPDDCLNPVVDPVVAMSHVELMLNRSGLSTCWGGYLKQVTNADPDLQHYLGIPDGCHMAYALMVGFARGENYPNIPPRPVPKINWRGISPEEKE